MRRLLCIVIVTVVAAAACGSGDGSFGSQPATEDGAIDAALRLQEAALRADADGIKRGLSAECLAAIDDDEFRAAIAFMRLFTATVDVDNVEVDVEVEEFDGSRAALSIDYVDDDGQPVSDSDQGFSLSADNMTLVHEEGRWVAEDCDFSSSDSSSDGCVDETGSMGQCPEPKASDRENPVGLGQQAYIGGGWVVRVGGVDFDAADRIEQESGFATDLEPGHRAVLVDLEVGYIGADEPQSPFSISIGGVGASNVGIDAFGCGFLPSSLDTSIKLFTGGAISGQQCLPTPDDDVDSLLLFAEAFGDERVFFDLQGDLADDAYPSASEPVPGSTHHDARMNPSPAGEPTDAGDWTVRITDADLDATEAVLAANDFADDPPAGSRYVVVGFEATFDGAEAASSNNVAPELVTLSNTSVDAGCSVSIEGEFDRFAEVFPGGTLAGDLCYLVPDADVDGLIAMVQPDFFGDDISFLALS